MSARKRATRTVYTFHDTAPFVGWSTLLAHALEQTAIMADGKLIMRRVLRARCHTTRQGTARRWRVELT